MKANNENFEICKDRAMELELYTNGDGYKCPDCGKVHLMEEYEQENGFSCPNCGKSLEEDELEAVGIYDYFGKNDVFDIEYRISADKSYKNVRVMIACGGPNIYIDTGKKAVCLYWANESAEFCLDYDTVNAIDDYFEELFNC